MYIGDGLRYLQLYYFQYNLRFNRINCTIYSITNCKLHAFCCCREYKKKKKLNCLGVFHIVIFLSLNFLFLSNLSKTVATLEKSVLALGDMRVAGIACRSLFIIYLYICMYCVCHGVQAKACHMNFAERKVPCVPPVSTHVYLSLSLCLVPT